ncbi:hypothetical protein TNCV_3698881 [Trichonephila clavipes]|uniref:Uncharacterized protein n=1 Tax=Trichonephila clavipes TaxID=2585209 RepID=A0A8X6SB73_TRICX|nr:hypothetical protein TNCV_3698881 [Trichonephila clavipes]
MQTCLLNTEDLQLPQTKNETPATVEPNATASTPATVESDPTASTPTQPSTRSGRKVHLPTRSVEAEIRLYQSDIDITKEMLYTSDESGNQVKCTIDKYWSKVFNLKDDFTNDYKYPALAKLVKACLSCFHGPLVESAFNLMDTLVTDYRTSLKIDSLDAVQTIK